jgi:hypothetical protein
MARYGILRGEHDDGRPDLRISSVNNETTKDRISPVLH